MAGQDVTNSGKLRNNATLGENVNISCECFRGDQVDDKLIRIEVMAYCRQAWRQ